MNMGNNKEEEKSALEQYGVDLTSKARDGKLDPVIGRDSVGRSSSPGMCLRVTSCCISFSRYRGPRNHRSSLAMLILET